MLGRKAHALIRDFQEQRVLLRYCPCGHANRTPCVWPGFQGIDQKVHQHLRQVLGITPHGW